MQKTKKKKQKTRNKGVALYIAFMIMTVLLVIVFGISAILFGELRVIRGMGDSVIAFYAADTGIERALYEGATSTIFSGSLENGSSYNVSVVASGGDCLAPNYCIRSSGIFKTTRRGIQVTR